MKNNFLVNVGEIMLCAALISGSYRSEAGDLAKEYVVKAAISLNLARFTEWPEKTRETNNGAIKLCLLGNQSVQQAFAQVDKKSIGKRFLHVVPVTLPMRPEQCDIIYVAAGEKAGAVQLLSAISGQPKLSIGEQDDFLEHGGMVNLIMKESKIDIQVNLDAVTSSGIKISSRVLALTTIVHVKN